MGDTEERRPGGWSAEEEQRILARLASHTQRRRLREALSDVVNGREYQELADLTLLRGIYALHDAGLSPEEIAQASGVAASEVSRRLQRRELHARTEGAREVILQRKTGAITTEEMLQKLGELRLRTRTPGRRAAFDAAASPGGPAKQLMAALRAGLLTEDEYEAIRAAVARRKRQ